GTGQPGTGRPVTGRPAIDRSAAGRVRLRRPRLTGRTMMVAAMTLFLVVILASPFQTYLNRRASVASSERQQRELSEHVAQLQAQTDQWKDPAYVERQARARLQYIRPGDTLYTVLNAQGQPLAAEPAPAGGTKVVRTGHQPSWNSTLWSSVQDAAK
nr:septum formation initiator family protein [Actinomycetota bacterium]